MSETRSGLPSVEEVRDELCGWPIGGGYYQSKVGADEAREMAIAVLALFEAAVPRIQAEALREARAEFERDWISFNPGGWGSNPLDQETLAFASFALGTMTARADRIESEAGKL